MHRQEYKIALNHSGFCGGSDDYSYWLSRDEILACLKFFGFKRIQISFDHPNHVHGPCFAYVTRILILERYKSKARAMYMIWMVETDLDPFETKKFQTG